MKTKKPTLFKKVFAVFLSLSLVFSCSSSINAATKTTKKVPKTAAAVVADMGIGWNLGNSLDAMNKTKGYTYDTETLWSNPVTTKKMIDKVAKSGFKAIRVQRH